MRRFLARLRATARMWWRMMRQQRVTRDGWFYVLFTVVVGTAALNTGNNLLYLVLGLQFSLILLSAVLSEAALRGIEVERILPRDAVAGEPMVVRLVVHNRKRRLPSFSLVLRELDGPARGARTLAVRVGPGEHARTSYRLTIPRRTRARFGSVLVSTSFPFGLFEKSREHELPAALDVFPPRSPPPRVHARHLVGEGERPEPRPGQGRDFHSLRELRPGDDPRLVHWRSSARAGQLLVIERERERRRRVTLQIDARGVGLDELDGAAEAAAALARRYVNAGYEVGMSWPGGDLPPGLGPAHLHQLLGVTARLELPPPGSPAPVRHRNAHAVPVPLGPARSRERVRPSTERLEDAGAPERAGRYSLRSVQRVAVFAALAAAFASVSLSGELPAWTTLVFVGSAAIGFTVGERGGLLLRHGATALAVGALIVLVAQVARGSLDVILAAPAFAVALASSRLVGRRGPVDDGLLLLSGLLLLAGGAALTGDLGYGLCFAAFAVAATVALCLSHLRAEMEAVEGPLASGRPGTVSGALVGAMATLSVAILAGSAVIFVVSPRFSAGMLHRARLAAPGVPDRIELGGLGVIKDDPAPALRVRFPGGPPGGDVYWRSLTFDAWDGKGWRRTGIAATTLTSRSGNFRLGTAERSLVAEVEVLGREPSLPVPGQPLGVRFPRRGGQLPPILVASADGTLEVKGAPDPLRYSVIAAPRTQNPLQGLGRAYPPDLLRVYTQLPADLDPRVRALGAELVRADPEESVTAALVWLSRLRYTRELPGDVDDPLVTFLFERRAGHCEFFATALTVLLRTQGIPARVAAGYYGVSAVEGADYFLVRRGDAHAWTEVFFPGEGWVRFDATPPADRAGESEGLYARALELLDVVRARWADLVVDFDTSRQVKLAEAVVEAFSARRREDGALAPAARWAVIVLALLGALFLALRLRRVLRRRPLDPAHRQAILLLRAVKREARRRGVDLPPGATAEEWARAVAASEPGRAAAYVQAVAAYHRARFGGAALPPEEARALRRAL